MTWPIVGGAAACGVGCLISWLNYKISKHILLTAPQRYAGSILPRQLLNIGWLVGCFFIGEYTCLDTTALLVGAVVGVTLPGLYFTKRLLSVNQTADQTNSKGKEDDPNG